MHALFFTTCLCACMHALFFSRAHTHIYIYMSLRACMLFFIHTHILTHTDGGGTKSAVMVVVVVCAAGKGLSKWYLRQKMGLVRH